MEVFKTTFFELIGQSKNCLITSHISPDEDSFASVLSVYEVVSKKFPSISFRIAYTGEPVPRFSSFKHYEKIEFVEDVATLVDEVDTVIMLDGGEFHRFTRNPEKLKTAPTTITIDHHASTPDTFTASLIDTSMTSTAELLFRLFENEIEMTKENTELFLLGILGDTGNFAYVKPAQTEIFVIAKKLLDTAQTSIEILQDRYRKLSKREFALIQILMKNTSYGEVSGWPDFQYSFIDKVEIEANNYSDVEVSAGSAMYIGRYLRSVTGYSWGFVATPRKTGDCHLSFRSVPGSVNVRTIVEQMGIGGGHDRAAGAAFKKVDHEIAPEEGIQNIMNWMKEHKPELK